MIILGIIVLVINLWGLSIILPALHDKDVEEGY